MLFSDVFVYLPWKAPLQPSWKKFPDQSLITSRHRSSSASILAAWHSSQSHSDSLFGIFGTSLVRIPQRQFFICRGKKSQTGDRDLTSSLGFVELETKNIWIIYELLLVCFPRPRKHLAALMERVLTLTIFALHSLLSKVLRRCGCLINARMHGLIVSSSRPCLYYI